MLRRFIRIRFTSSQAFEWPSASLPEEPIKNIRRFKAADYSGFVKSLSLQKLELSASKLESLSYSPEMESVTAQDLSLFLDLLSQNPLKSLTPVTLYERIMKKKGYQMDSASYHKLLKIYSVSKSTADMKRLLETMTENGIQETAYTYNRILALIPLHEASVAIDLFENMVKTIKPNVETLLILFHKCNSDSGNPQWAVDYYEDHIESLKAIDTIQFLMISLYGRVGNIAKSEACFNEIKTRYVSDTLGKVQESAEESKTKNNDKRKFMFKAGTAMMDAYVRETLVERVFEVKAWLENAGIFLDAVGHLPIFRALDQLNRHAEILPLLNKILVDGHRLTPSFINYFCSLAKKHSWVDEALSLVKKAFDAHILIHNPAIKSLLELCLAHQKYDDAVPVIKVLLDRAQPYDESLKMAVEIAYRADSLDLLKQAWAALEAKGCRIEIEYYGYVIHASLKGKDFDMAIQTLEKIESTDFANADRQRFVDPLLSIITLAAESRKYELAIRALKQLRDLGSSNMDSVDVIVRNHQKEFERSLAKLCVDGGDQSLSMTIENRRLALALYRQLGNIGSIVSETTLRLVMKAHLAESDLVGVVRVYSTLLSNYKRPQPESTLIVLRACNTLGKDRTFHALYQMIKKEELPLSRECYSELLILCAKHNAQSRMLTVLVNFVKDGFVVDLELYKTLCAHCKYNRVGPDVKQFFEEGYPHLLEEYEAFQKAQAELRQSLLPF